MIKVYMTTTAGRKSDMFDSETKIREIFNHFGVDYGTGTNTIDGVRLDTAGFEKTLAQWGAKEECRLASIVKVDNAAVVDLTGAAAVVVSSVKLADWKKVEEFRPDALKLTDDKDEVVFRVMTSKGNGSIDKNGVAFGAQTNNGYATVTMQLADNVKDKKAAVKKVAAAGLSNLKTIEDGIGAVLAAIATDEANVDAMFRDNGNTEGEENA